MSQSELNFNVKWPNFEYRQISSIANLLVNQNLVDCRLILEGQEIIPAHRLILSASSEYFRKLFCDSNDDIFGAANVRFSNIAYKDLFNVVKFIYTGKLKLSQEDLVSFMKVGKFLEVKGIMDLEIDIANQHPQSELKSHQGPKQSFEVQKVQNKNKAELKRSSEVDVTAALPLKKKKLQRRNTIHFGRAELALLEEDEDERTPCNFCYRKFLSYNTAKNHIRFCEKNPDRKISRCQICNEIVKPGSMTYHKKTRHGHIPVPRSRRVSKATVSSCEI